MKRLSALFFAALMCLSCLTPVFSAEEAEDLTSSCKLVGPEADSTRYLLFDGNTKTGMIAEHGTTVSLEASKPIRSLYLVWGTPHAQWDAVLMKNGAETFKTYGENEFLHEYVDLGDNYDAVTFKFNGSDSILCDVYAFSGGDVPEWVQIWQPPLEKADLLVLPARAGDEFLYFGGTVPYYIKKGKSVQVAYITNLFNEPFKTHELLNALYSSGLRTYPVISSFPEIIAANEDSASEYYDVDELFKFVTELLRRFKPEVVVGQGEYGDGVQMLSSSVTTVAAELSGDKLEYVESVERYGEWDVPKLYLHGRTDSGTHDLDKQWLEMDWGESLDIAKQALTHYSWRQNRDIVIDGMYDCRKFDLYRTTVGTDVEKDDFFENIGSAKQKEPEIEAEAEPAKQTAPPAEAKPVSTTQKWRTLIISNIAVLLSSSIAIPSLAVLMIAAAIILRFKKD